MRIDVYCSCGEKIAGTVVPAEAADRMKNRFLDRHSGPGHKIIGKKEFDEMNEREERLIGLRPEEDPVDPLPLDPEEDEVQDRAEE